MKHVNPTQQQKNIAWRYQVSTWGILRAKLLPGVEGSLTIIKAERSAATKRWIMEKSERRRGFGKHLLWLSFNQSILGIKDFEFQSKHLEAPLWLSVKACWLYLIHFSCISLVQSLSRVRLFETPCITTHQASLSITNSRSSLKLMSIESVMPSSHLILCCPLLLPKTKNNVSQWLMCFAKRKWSTIMRSYRCLISLWYYVDQLQDLVKVYELKDGLSFPSG